MSTAVICSHGEQRNRDLFYGGTRFAVRDVCSLHEIPAVLSRELDVHLWAPAYGGIKCRRPRCTLTTPSINVNSLLHKDRQSLNIVYSTPGFETWYHWYEFGITAQPCTCIPIAIPSSRVYVHAHLNLFLVLGNPCV